MTVGVSYLHLSVGAAIALALFIAAIKGSLVAAFFMHLISERKLIYAVLILTAGVLFGVDLSAAGRLCRSVGLIMLGLKGFHVFFICVSILLCLAVGAWGFSSTHRRQARPDWRWPSSSSLSGAALVIYAVRYFGKLKKLDR